MRPSPVCGSRSGLSWGARSATSPTARASGPRSTSSTRRCGPRSTSPTSRSCAASRCSCSSCSARRRRRMPGPPPRELEVPASAAGARLDAWLADALGEASRAATTGLIESGAVLVDGAVRPKGTRLRGGEHVTVAAFVEADTPGAPPEPAIVWEADDLIVVDKPAGLVVHPAPGHRGVTLVELIARSGADWQPRAAHRLDRDTSGLMLVA